MLDRIEFILGEALVALRRHGLMTLAAVSTVAVSLFLLGGLGYVYMRASASAEQLPGMFEVRVILKDGTPYARIKQLAKDIRALKGVAEARWVPKDKEWERWQKRMPEVTQGMENPLPDEFKVKMTDLESADLLDVALRKLPGVETIRSDPHSQRQALGLLNMVRWLGGVLGALMLATAGILIHNAIRLTIVARRREIRIMQLVGAPQATVRTPFLLEGCLQGVLGGAIANLLIWSSNVGFASYVRDNSFLMSVPPYPVGKGFAALLIAGALYGAICSMIAIREPLKLR